MEDVHTFLSKFRFVDEDAQDGILTPESIRYRDFPKNYILAPRTPTEHYVRYYVLTAVSHQLGCWINAFALDDKDAWRMPYAQRVEQYFEMAKRAACDDCMKTSFRENWITFAGREWLKQGRKAYNRICKDDVDWVELLEDEDFLADVMKRVKSRKVGNDDFDTYTGSCHCKRRYMN